MPGYIDSAVQRIEHTAGSHASGTGVEGFMVEAKFEKSGSLEAMGAPLLDVYTQDKPKADALFMLADALEALVNKELSSRCHQNR